eukprot:TRINITY_DN14772_c0_g1_i2.p1 TRINITY_DN14772_c0_g1~~TRINITY_DN14772_c0_g1_i2.p1  ORF type:complete len:531 (-),score=73.02 TRINITY_DN14772_c0_g1_i2:331-1923(-)
MASAPSVLQLEREGFSRHVSHGGADVLPSRRSADVLPSRLARERADVADFEKGLLESSDGLGAHLRRSNSWAGIYRDMQGDKMKVLKEAGGFRRGFLHERAKRSGVPRGSRPRYWSLRLVSDIAPSLTRGESLEEFRSVMTVCDLNRYGLDPFLLDFCASAPVSPVFCADDNPSLEEAMTPLLLPEQRKISRRSTTLADGKLGVLGAGLAIFKVNCNIGILFMPQAFESAGYFYAIMSLILISVLAVACTMRLLNCRMQIGQQCTYGDIVGVAAGRVARRISDIAIVLLQSGICCVYFVSISKLLQSALFPLASIRQLIWSLNLVMMPLAAVRKVSKLWVFTTLGTTAVIIGVFTILGVEGSEVYAGETALQDLELVRWENALMFMGTACYVFEGIGCMMPIYDSTRDQDKFPAILIVVFVIFLGLNIAIGMLGSWAYREAVQAIVLLNLPEGILRTAMQLAFAFTMIFTFPLQLLPAVCLVDVRTGYAPPAENQVGPSHLRPSLRGLWPEQWDNHEDTRKCSRPFSLCS